MEAVMRVIGGKHHLGVWQDGEWLDMGEYRLHIIEHSVASDNGEPYATYNFVYRKNED